MPSLQPDLQVVALCVFEHRLGYAMWCEMTQFVVLAAFGRGAIMEQRGISSQQYSAARVLPWPAYYWNLTKEFGKECWRTWRGEVAASVVVLVFIFLINRNTPDLKTALIAVAYTIAAFSLWHLVRMPWLLHKKYLDSYPLSLVWGIAGICFGSFIFCLAVFTAMWFYTMQPPINISTILPDNRDARIAVLEQKVKELTPDQSSLKSRTLKSATELEIFFRQREKHMPTCTQTSTMTQEQQQIAGMPCAQYNIQTQNLYQQRFAPNIMAMVDEFKGKGMNVINIENCAPGGWCGINISVQLRAFAARLDDKDNIKR